MKKNRNTRAYRRSMWPLMLLLVFVMIAALMTVAGALFLSAEFTVSLQGSEKVTLAYGETYTDAGAKVYFADRELEQQVQITGQVDSQTLGEYEIVYTAQVLNRTTQAKRIVEVVDITPPVITLTTDPDTYTEPGQEYEEEGYCAIDDVDGDLTDKVVRTEEDGVVTYSVTDASGNTTTVERPIVYNDKTPPELVLLGEKTITITAGEKFLDPGYTATDNVDGDITANVVISGEYDTDVAGEYVIRYTVSDSCGNSAEAERTLKVEEPPKEEAPEDTEELPEKVIYLTFDDGPGSRTLELLDILAKYDAKATFFVVGTAYLEYLDEIADAGHAIGLHANSHDYSKIYAGTNAFFKDLYALQDKVYEHTGIRSNLHRFPGGSSNTISKKYCPGIMTKLTAMVEDEGFVYFDWHVDSCDASGADTAREVYNNVISGIGDRDVAVVLQHDIKDYSIDAVEMILKWGIDNGYTFLALDENSPTIHHTVQN